VTDAVVHLSGAASCRRPVAAVLGRSLYRATIAQGTRRALDELPDKVLRDIGLMRSDIPFIAGELALGDRSTMERGRRPRRLRHVVLSLASVAVVAVLTFAVTSRAILAQDTQIARGKYLITLGGCNDCHTPGYFFGKPDMARFLGGSEVGFEIPDRGVFHGPNLTTDQETGLGQWSTEEIVTAITTGQRPDGRILSPIMPWHAFANLTRQDAGAIATFLKSLPPVKNKVPGPFGPSETPTSFVMKIVAPEAATIGHSASK